jgi:hypothetical protein
MKSQGMASGFAYVAGDRTAAQLLIRQGGENGITVNNSCINYLMSICDTYWIGFRTPMIIQSRTF